METRLRLDISQQPDDTTCGPTSLHAVYRFHGDPITLEEVVHGVTTLEGGGTLGVHLANHALERGYSAEIFTYNLQIFDPSWFVKEKPVQLAERLQTQCAVKTLPHLRDATDAYLKFLELGGGVYFEDLTGKLLRRFLDRGIPILTGLSATYLYRTPRERPDDNEYDDIRGEPTGHFVILCGYDRSRRCVLVADPMYANPLSANQTYEVNIDRLLGAILLGTVTYDANLVVIEKH